MEKYGVEDVEKERAKGQGQGAKVEPNDVPEPLTKNEKQPKPTEEQWTNEQSTPLP